MNTKAAQPQADDRYELTDDEIELLIVDSAQRIAMRADVIKTMIDRCATERDANLLQKITGTGDVRKARRRLQALQESLRTLSAALGDLEKVDAFAGRVTAGAKPAHRPGLRPSTLLPPGVASAIRKCQLDLPPLQSRQLDSLVRKLLGVADPRPEPSAADAETEVIALADRIVRASVAAYIQQVQHGGPK